MSKLDVGVGEDFPLDTRTDTHGRRGHRHGGRHAHHEHHHFKHHHFGRHRGHGFARLPMLLLIAGLAALIVAGKIPVAAAWAMVAAGAVLMLALILVKARHMRRHLAHQGQKA